MRYVLSILALTVTLGVATPSHALEVSAGRDNQATQNNGILSRIQAGDALLQTTINQILKCNNKGKYFVSNQSIPGRDADGCKSNDIDPTKYDIVQETKTVALPQSCKGKGDGQCSVVIDMTPYTGKVDVSITAGCNGAAWCGTGVGTISTPLATTWSNKRVYTFPYKKANYVNASYNAGTKKMTLSSGYTGKSTNFHRGAVNNVRVTYTGFALKEIK